MSRPALDFSRPFPDPAMAKPILLIDDEEKFALMLQDLLKAHGFEADYCLNPKEAVERVRQENYDLVISDYKMPHMDGAEFLQEARKINPDLPVIMISGLMNMPELIKVANIGVTLVLEKPFKTEELMERVSRLVRPDTGASRSQAMDMEASEISFQQDYIETTYPAPARFLSDASRDNKRFLESLWKAANICRHLPFYAQAGAEVRLVARELMGWTGAETNAEVVRVTLEETASDLTRSWISNTETVPGAFLIDLQGHNWDADTITLLSAWVHFLEGCGKDLAMTRVLYLLPIGLQFQLDALRLSQHLRSLFAQDYPVLLSLRDRVQDTAEYILRLLEPAALAQLGGDGLLRLLHYPWPGGYRELEERLRDVNRRMDGNEKLTETDICEMLAEGAGDPRLLLAPTDLEHFLKRRQAEYIQLHQKEGEETRETVARLGIDAPSVKIDDVLAGRQLAFPSVLNSDANP